MRGPQGRLVVSKTDPALYQTLRAVIPTARASRRAAR
jgi:hypothetical protein